MRGLVLIPPALLLLLSLAATLPTEAAIPPEERAALIAFYDSTNGDSWTNNSGWKGEPGTECSWFGIECDGDRVVELVLEDNGLSGSLPPEIGQLVNLAWLKLPGNELTGSIPAEIGLMLGLGWIDLSGNQLTGTIPEGINLLPHMHTLALNDNQLTGPIPSNLNTWQLTNLGWLHLNGNRLTGSIPVTLGELQLALLNLSDNQLTGVIPAELGNLSDLEDLDLSGNALTGAIPSELGQLNKLRTLVLRCNRLTGSIPPELGDLVGVTNLNLSSNQLSGEVPAELMNLTAGGLIDLAHNALSATDPALDAFLDGRAGPGDFSATQTIAPTDVTLTGVTETTATLTWTPIEYMSHGGGYRIEAATSLEGPYTIAHSTNDKSVLSATVTQLSPLTNYYFRLRSTTDPHDCQASELVSEPSSVVEATTTTAVPEPARVAATRLPEALVQVAGTGGDTTRFTLTNLGEVATTITLNQTGTFFTQNPVSLELPGGSSKTVRITGLAQAEGEYTGASVASGDGVPDGFSVPVRLLSNAPPTTGTASAEASTNRVDVAAPSGDTLIEAKIDFTNRGDATLTGIIVADVPWIIPPEGIVTIQPGETVTITFQIDRTMRPDSDAPLGSVAGSLSLVYASGSATAGVKFVPFGEGVATTLVTVVDTASTTADPGTIPLIRDDEIALFMPGLGHVVGTVGTFVSDVVVVAPDFLGLTGLDLYFTATGNDPANETVQTTIDRMQANQLLLLADLIKGIFERDGETGSLQVRVPKSSKVSVSANVFNASNPAGTYGSAIPVLRSDRGVSPGESTYLTGLLGSSAAAHTNLILQETAGGPVTVDIVFYDENASQVGPVRGEFVEAYRVARVNDVVPPGAVSAVLTNRTSSSGEFLAFATPVDKALETDGSRKGGDTWVVADWSRHYGYLRSEPVLIPVVGLVHGANETFFRTDLSIMNTSGASAEGTLTFHSDAGETLNAEVTLGALESVTYDNVMGSLFDVDTRALGYLVFTPGSGEFVLTSRTYATVGNQVATFGTGVPTVALSSGLRLGEARRVSGFDESGDETVSAATPATFRTNFGLIETAGKDATVRVTLYNLVSESSRALSASLPNHDYVLAPGQFLMLSQIAKQILEEDREDAFRGDLKNLYAEFRVIDGEGCVVVFTSSIDNGTGDQILKMD